MSYRLLTLPIFALSISLAQAKMNWDLLIEDINKASWTSEDAFKDDKLSPLVQNSKKYWLGDDDKPASDDIILHDIQDASHFYHETFKDGNQRLDFGLFNDLIGDYLARFYAGTVKGYTFGQKVDRDQKKGKLINIAAALSEYIAKRLNQTTETEERTKQKIDWIHTLYQQHRNKSEQVKEHLDNCLQWIFAKAEIPVQEFNLDNVLQSKKTTYYGVLDNFSNNGFFTEAYINHNSPNDHLNVDIVKKSVAKFITSMKALQQIAPKDAEAYKQSGLSKIFSFDDVLNRAHVEQLISRIKDALPDADALKETHLPFITYATTFGSKKNIINQAVPLLKAIQCSEEVKPKGHGEAGPEEKISAIDATRSVLDKLQELLPDDGPGQLEVVQSCLELTKKKDDGLSTFVTMNSINKKVLLTGIARIPANIRENAVNALKECAGTPKEWGFDYTQLLHSKEEKEEQTIKNWYIALGSFSGFFNNTGLSLTRNNKERKALLTAMSQCKPEHLIDFSNDGRVKSAQQHNIKDRIYEYHSVHPDHFADGYKPQRG